MKKTIPVWATLSASQLARAQKQTHMASSSRPKMDEILTEAIKVRSQPALPVIPKCCCGGKGLSSGLLWFLWFSGCIFLSGAGFAGEL